MAEQETQKIDGVEHVQDHNGNWANAGTNPLPSTAAFHGIAEEAESEEKPKRKAPSRAKKTK